MTIKGKLQHVTINSDN